MTQTTTPSTDPFTSSVTQLAITASKQRKLVFVGVGLMLAFLAAYSIYTGKKNSRDQASQQAFFAAKLSLDSELETVTRELKPRPATPTTKKESKAQPQVDAPIDIAAIEFTPFNVKQKLQKSIPAFEGVAKNFDGTLAGFNAKMTLGNLFFKNGNSLEDTLMAAQWFEAASTNAPKTEFTVAALSSLGYAQEVMGKCDLAIKSFDKALNYGDSLHQIDLLKSKARCFETLGDKNQAKATYEKLISIAPQSEAARYAQNKMSQVAR
jgi:tetratricopeptide (TPR) repeat protein